MNNNSGISTCKLAKTLSSSSELKKVVSKQLKGVTNKEYTCPICLEEIIDDSKFKIGQDSIHCDGDCNIWLHMGCAGLSKVALMTISGQSKPFSCQKCRLLTKDQEIIVIKLTVDILRQEVSSLKQSVNQLSHGVTSISDLNDLDKSVKLSDLPIPIRSYYSIVSSDCPSTNSARISSNTDKRTDNSYSYTTQDRKFNIVIHGVKECPQTCLYREDLNVSVFFSL